MYIMADGLTRLVAPILSFTADELWRVLPGKREESVHLEVFPARPEPHSYAPEPLVRNWTSLLGLRERVLALIEPLRKEKQIGSSLQAQVAITANAADFQPLVAHLDKLPMLFIVSEVTLTQGDAPAGTPAITILRADGVKCERCWRYVKSVSTDPASAGLCDRCQDALAEPIHG